MKMSFKPVWLNVCSCKYDVAELRDGPGGWRVVCDPELGGCGAEGGAEASPALAVATWNGGGGSAAGLALTAAAARRAMAEGVGE